MFDKLRSIEDKFHKLEKTMSTPDIVKDQDKYMVCVREHSELAKIVSSFREYKAIVSDLDDILELSTDDDFEIRSLAKEEEDRLNEDKKKILEKIKSLLLPKDPLDDKNVILEIRAGTGGEEAALFAGDLLRMYHKYSENMEWKLELLSCNSTGIGGIKEVIANISGKNAYSRLKYESGTHRVQRVPTTETQGRIHTSAVTVAVLPEAEEIEIKIDQSEMRIDVFRSSGPGGQSVNTTDSAVRITHLPTGLVVTCQDEKSQHKNKAKAMKVLRSRLLDKMIKDQNEVRSSERKNQVGSGDRSERIRTYNFPQTRVTDHRIGVTLHKLDSILRGEMDVIIDPLVTFYQRKALQKLESIGAEDSST